MAYYRCSECRKPIGVMLENDGTKRLFVCPYTHRAATADRCEGWGLVQAGNKLILSTN